MLSASTTVYISTEFELLMNVQSTNEKNEYNFECPLVLITVEFTLLIDWLLFYFVFYLCKEKSMYLFIHFIHLSIYLSINSFMTVTDFCAGIHWLLKDKCRVCKAVDNGTCSHFCLFNPCMRRQ